MPQVRKGPRLYLYNRKGRDSTWIIRDDAKQIWLCTADFSEAQKCLERYLANPKTFRTKVTEKKPRRKPSDVLWIYAVEVGAEDRPIKIGVAAHVPTRFSCLQVSSPFPLKLLASMPVTREMERRIHRKLQPFRIRGEWFRRTPEVETAVAAIANDALEVIFIPRLVA